MRLVFMGTPDFAAEILEACLAVHEVAAVYTRPDAVSGRGSSLRPSPVKQLAESYGVPVLQPRTLRDTAEQQVLRDLAPETIVVAAFGLILPRAVLEIPPFGCVNVHASLLPRWRGAAPVQRAILAGDELTGVSIMRMEEGLDTGPYDSIATVAIDDLDAAELTRRLAEAGAAALLGTLDRIETGTVEWVSQDESLATYAEKLTRADVTLAQSDAVATALRKIRASGPQAASKISVDGRGVTLLEAHAAKRSLPAGRVFVAPDGLDLGLGDGAVRVVRLKPDGKGEMDAAAWARGARPSADARWETP